MAAKSKAGEGKTPPPPDPRTESATIALSKHQKRVLRAVALARQVRTGKGRASVSKIVQELVDGEMTAFEKEAAPFLELIADEEDDS